MPDARVQTAVHHWKPRFVADGVDLNDFERTVAGIETWREWAPAWMRLGDERAGLAEEAEAAGRWITAGEHRLAAAMAYHFAKFLWFEDRALYEDAHRKTAECYARGAPWYFPPAERLAVPYAGGELRAVLRKPYASAFRPPVVILVPGLDSTKEEMHFYAEPFLRRGMATLALDGPGQGESEFDFPIEPAYEGALAAACEALRGRADVDAERVGVMGVSFGGHYGIRGLARVPGIAAAVAINPFFRLADHWDALPVHSREGFTVRSGAADEAAARRRAAELTLEDVAEEVRKPLLLIHGDRDTLFPTAGVRRIAEAARGPVDLVVYPEGNHVCNNVAYKYRPLMADWMKERLGA